MSKPFDATAWAKERTSRIARAKELKAERKKLKDEGEITAEHTFKPKLSTSKNSRNRVKGSIGRAQPKEGKYRESRNCNKAEWNNNSGVENEKKCFSHTVPLPSQSLRITRDLSLLKKKKKYVCSYKGEGGEAQSDRMQQRPSPRSSATIGVVSYRSTPTSKSLISETGVGAGCYNHQQDVMPSNGSSERYHRGHGPGVSDRGNERQNEARMESSGTLSSSSPLSFRDELEMGQQQQQQDELGNCRGCGRSFSLSRLKIHENICVNHSHQQRKPFNSRKMRTTQGTDSPVLMSQQQKSSKVKRDPGYSSTRKKSNDKWRQQSKQLREAIKTSRAVSKAQKEGKSLRDLPVTYSEPDPTYVQCPHCSKRFNQMAGERHIPKCLSIRSKPKMLMKGSGIGIGLQARKSMNLRGTF